jgi:hypothetical protein
MDLPVRTQDRAPTRRPFATLTAALCAGLTLTACVVAPVPRHGGGAVYPPVVREAPTANPAMYFYPERGQSDSTQDRDRYECYRWAVRESGVDPGMTPVRQAAAPLPPARNPRDGADVVGGAVTGAVVGAAMSSPRHAGPNAAIGAVFGALLGAAAQESRAQAVENAQARREAAWEAQQQPMNNFRRAMGACMQGRGYRIG